MSVRKNGNIIISDSDDAKVTLTINQTVLDPSYVEKTMDISISELISADDLITPVVLSPTRSSAEWEELCSSSLAYLGYPSPVTASGLKVVPYDSYYSAYNYSVRLKSAISKSISRFYDKHLLLVSTFTQSRGLFDNVLFPGNSHNDYANFSTEKVNFSVMNSRLNNVKNSVEEILNIISSTIPVASTNLQAPSKPILISPKIDEIVGVIRPRMSWSKEDFAVRWQLDLSYDTNFKNITYTNEVFENSVTLNEDLTPGKMYWWRVTAFNENYDASDVSDSHSFQISNTAIVTPEIQSVAIPIVLNEDSTLSNNGSVVISWDPSSLSEEKWRVLYTRDTVSNLKTYATTNTSVQPETTGPIRTFITTQNSAQIPWYEDSKFANTVTMMNVMVQPIVDSPEVINAKYSSNIVYRDMLPTIDTLRASEYIVQKEGLVSANRKYTLLLQTDGNLVLYYNAPTPVPLWSSNTVGKNTKMAVMQPDGNFVLYDTNNQGIFSTNTYTHANLRSVLQNDGNLVIYDPQNHAYAATQTNKERTGAIVPMIPILPTHAAASVGALTITGSVPSDLPITTTPTSTGSGTPLTFVVPKSPVLVSPGNESAAVKLGTSFNWNSGDGSNTTGYRLQVSKQSTFSELIVDDATISSQVTTYPIDTEEFLPSTTYYWRVSAKNTVGISPWSTSWKYTTAKATIGKGIIA